MHGSTFGGNPISAAAALAVLDTIESEDLLANARARGEQLREGLSALPGVVGVRGAGLLLGVVLEAPAAKAVEATAREGGALVNAAAPDVVRLAPPLILSPAQAEHAIAILAEALATVRRQPDPAPDPVASTPAGAQR
jgi:acetylornithine aminotransferase